MNWEKEKQHYDAFHDQSKIFRLPLCKITAVDCNIPTNVCLFLDDTSNGYHGIGNTCFVDLLLPPFSSQQQQGLGEGTGIKGGIGIGITRGGGGGQKNSSFRHEVEWCMMGAQDGNIKMPDTAKIVVYGLCPAAAAKKHSWGIMGGLAFPIRELLQKGKMVVPIINSFIELPEEGPLKICDVVLEMDPHVAKSKLEEFDSRYHDLFHPSKLPTKEQINVVKNINQFINNAWVDRMQQGIYALPSNAPDGFLSDLSRSEQIAVLQAERGYSMCREGFTLNASLYGQVFPHALAALPAMAKEHEQQAITCPKILVYAFDYTMKVMQRYGWTLDSLADSLEKNDDNHFSDEMCSAIMSFLLGIHNAAATQKYDYDWMTVKAPMPYTGTKVWTDLPGMCFVCVCVCLCLFFKPLNICVCV
jgi:hypothetical protein